MANHKSAEKRVRQNIKRNEINRSNRSKLRTQIKSLRAALTAHDKDRSNELLKGVGGRSRSTGGAPGNPEEVLDAVFDFAENLIAQQRAFSKQMLHAASQGQQTIASAADVAHADPAAGRSGPTGVAGTSHVPGSTTTPGASAPGTPGS